MSFHWLGEWGMVYFEWPQRWLGFALLALYALLFSALFVRVITIYHQRRNEFRGTWIRKLFWLMVWSVSAALLANIFRLDWPAAHLPTGFGQNRDPLTFFAFVPIALAAAQLGAGPAAFVGMIGGWVSGGFGSGRLLQIFEVGTFGLLVSLLLYQDYQGRVGWLLRQPLVALPWAGATTWLLMCLSFFSYAERELSALSAISSVIATAVANLPVILIQSAVAGLILQVVYAVWPQMQAVQHATRVPTYARSISRRFLFFFLPSAAIVLVVVLYAVMAQALRIALDQSIDQIAHVASNVSIELPFFQWTGQQLLSGVALDDDLQSTEYERREASLERGMKTLPFFNQIALINKSDPELIPRIVVPPPERLHGLTAKESLLLELTLRDGSPQVTEVHRDAAGVPIISFLVPVRSAFATQEVVGALIGRVHVTDNYQLRGMVSNLQPPGVPGDNRGIGFLVNEANRIVAHPDASQILEDWTVNPEPAVVHESADPFATVYEDMTGSDHTRQLVYSLETEGVPWRIVVIRPYENVLAQATEISSPLLVLFLVAGLVVTISMPIFTTRLTRPLEVLSRAASEIANNNLDVEVRVAGDDEVGQLGRSFEQMRQRLRERMDQLFLLLQISQDVSTSMELAPSLMPILKGAMQATGGCVARIVLIDDRGRPEKSVCTDSQKLEKAMARLDGAVSVVVKRNRELVIEDITKSQTAPPAELLDAGIRAVVGLPLRLQDRVTGVLWVGYERARRFDQADLSYLYTLTGQAAVVAANARLFEHVEEERGRLKAILSSTNDVVIVVSASGHVLLSNPAGMHTYGIIPHEVVGMPLDEAIVDPALRDLLTRPMNVGSALADEVKAPDNRTFSASVSLLAGGGRVVTLRDITYLKELDQMKSDFVNTVSHDLRSPLTYMRGFTTMIPMAGHLNEKQQGFVDKILSGIEQMAELIDDLLDIGKIEAGVGIEIERCWLPGLVQAVVDDLGMRAQSQGIELDANLPADIPPTMADKTLLRQAVENLVDNAIKYTPEPGRVVVSLDQNEDALIVRVADNGIGIAPEYQKSLFQKFFRIKRRETAHIKGTGLGLAIVKSVADQHRGRVWVESKLNQGSTFFLAIPLVSLEPGDPRSDTVPA